MRCLRVGLEIQDVDKFDADFFQKLAKSLEIEGFMEINGQNIQIHMCGPLNRIDEFMDHIHKIHKRFSNTDLVIEPFLKTKDFRGIFRVIK